VPVAIAMRSSSFVKVGSRHEKAALVDLDSAAVATAADSSAMVYYRVAI